MSDGTVQELTPDRMERAGARFEKELDYAEKAEEHVWIVTVAHRITADLARALANGTAAPPLLDAESVAVTGVGCYRCEKPLDRQLVGKRCRGTR